MRRVVVGSAAIRETTSTRHNESTTVIDEGILSACALSIRRWVGMRHACNFIGCCVRAATGNNYAITSACVLEITACGPNWTHGLLKGVLRFVSVRARPLGGRSL